MNYYFKACKNCGKDCDGNFCSDSCSEEWESFKADFIAMVMGEMNKMGLKTPPSMILHERKN